MKFKTYEKKKAKLLDKVIQASPPPFRHGIHITEHGLYLQDLELTSDEAVRVANWILKVFGD